MNLRRLAHIVALAERRNFARASEEVHLSQPALTRSIQAAEAELGLRLFDRGTTQVTPTPAGEFVIERARRLVFDGRCLKRDVDLYRDRKLGDTAFGVGPFPAATFVATCCRRCAASSRGGPARRSRQLGQAARAPARRGHRVLRRRHARAAARPAPRLKPLRPSRPGSTFGGPSLARRRSVSPRCGRSASRRCACRRSSVGARAPARARAARAAPRAAMRRRRDPEEAALATDLVLGAPHAPSMAK